MNRELVCIGCPMGCRLTVELEEAKVLAVTGNSCLKGAEYARNECTNPTRMLTTTIVIEGAMYPLLSVRSTQPIPKGMIMECVDYLRWIKVEAPVKIGQIIVKNILNTRADIIATKNMPRNSTEILALNRKIQTGITCIQKRFKNFLGKFSIGNLM